MRRTQPEPPLRELDDIRAFLDLKEASPVAAQPSEINWGMLRNGLFGSWMKARLLPGGEQQGSRPTPLRVQDAAGWKLLHRRKLKNGKKTLYVRGHLSHDAFGGPGVDYNLAALTAASDGDFGANQANFVHRYLVEGPLLWAYRNMHGPNPTITEVNYYVIADDNRPPREGTEELKQIAITYRETAEQVQAKLEAEGAVLAEPTHEQLMNELALNPPSPHLKDAMWAISAEATENWRAVYERIKENQKLWQFEDQNVSVALKIEYSWVENGMLRGPVEETVPVVLPSSLSARFLISN